MSLLNFFFAVLIVLFVGAIIVGISFWLINTFASDAKLNKILKGLLVAIVLIGAMILLAGGYINLGIHNTGHLIIR